MVKTYTMNRRRFAVKDYLSQVWHLVMPDDVDVQYYSEVGFAVIDFAPTLCGLIIRDPEKHDTHPDVLCTILHRNESSVRLCGHCNDRRRNPRADWERKE